VYKEIRHLIRKMSRVNPLWCAPRIHGNCPRWASTSVKRAWASTWHAGESHGRKTWQTVLENHVKTMVSIDFFTVPIIRYQVLYDS
jgi:hypothetical protein